MASRIEKLLLAVVAVIVAVPVGMLTQPANAAENVSACSLLTREEAKKLAPWPALFDQIKTQEDTLANGSGCAYPNVQIQVMSMSQDAWKRWVAAFKNATLESVAGIGEEGYFRDNQQMWAEVIAKVGTQVVTIQLSPNAGETPQAAKPRAIALAKALAAKLR